MRRLVHGTRAGLRHDHARRRRVGGAARLVQLAGAAAATGGVAGAARRGGTAAGGAGGDGRRDRRNWLEERQPAPLEHGAAAEVLVAERKSAAGACRLGTTKARSRRRCGAGLAGVGTGAFATGATGGAAARLGFDRRRGRRRGWRGRCAAACCCCVISFRTSPGLEMCERSILVLISSSLARLRAGARAGDGGFGSRRGNGAHLLRFVVFERTGVRLLLGDTNFRKNVENRLAFDFQLPSQIVDSNLTHPPFLPPDCPAKSSCQPHGV